jgi:phage terminase small subunit
VTEFDRRFALHYLQDLNATQAYLRAKLPVKVKLSTAKANGHRMLLRDEVQALVLAERDRLLSSAELTATDTLVKLKQMLMYDPRKMFREDGSMIPIHELPDDLAAACVGFKDTIAGREIKLADKVAVLEKAMKYHGLFEKDNKQTADAITEVLFAFKSPGGKVEPVPG